MGNIKRVASRNGDAVVVVSEKLEQPLKFARSGVNSGTDSWKG
jgi:hypothetical protein